MSESRQLDEGQQVEKLRKDAESLIYEATKLADRAWHMPFARRHSREKSLQEARVNLEKARVLIERIEAMTEPAKAEASAASLADLHAAQIEAAHFKNKIMRIEAEGRAEALRIERHAEAAAEAERFRSILGSIQQVVGTNRMEEVTGLLIRALMSIDDVQSFMRVMGWRESGRESAVLGAGEPGRRGAGVAGVSPPE